MAKMTMVQALNLALRQEMEKDDRVIVLGEDVGRDGGVFRVTDGLLDTFGERRVLDTPLAESGIVGMSVGMAVYGLRPVAEIQFSGFIYEAFHQLESHAARLRDRSQGRYHVPLVVRAPYAGGVRALEHHSESREVYFAHTPGLKMVIPSGPRNARALLVAAIRDPDPVLFFEPKRIYRAIKEEVPDGEYTVPLGKARVLREGDDLTVISWGAMVREALRAAEAAEAEGFRAEVIDLRTISPLDDGTFLESVRKTGRALVVHEAPRTCGVGAEIVARINEEALLSLQAPVLRVTGFDTVMPLYQLENHYLPDAERILAGIRKVMNF